jgi:hypothetical protein
MTKMVFSALAALVLLAGCGTAPVAPLAASHTAAALGARVNTSTHAALVTVPADVMNYMEDHYAQLTKKFNRSSDHVGVGVYLVMSNDHFKHDRHEAQLDPKSFPGSGSREFMLGMVNGDIAPGPYEYYLVMRGLVSHSVPGSVSFDSLDDFYVSNYGKNYQVTIK